MKFSSNTVIVCSDGTTFTFGNIIELLRKLSFRDILPNENEHLYILRKNRFDKCFRIIDNRSKLWYNDLSDEQYTELRNWRQAWLDVTDTLIEPETPSWINNKLEGEQLL